MSAGKRAYDLLRGYVHQEWERIKGIERSDAEQELAEAMARTSDPGQERVPSEPRTPAERRERARRLLGVADSASFSEVRRQFERLNRRSDPANFPAGSSERREAAELQRRVRWAYQVLTEDMDATEKRFGSLEIEP